MTTEPQPWPGATYRGFSGPAPAGPTPSGPTPRPRPPARAWPVPRAVAVGVAGALLLGVVGGLWARPELAPPRTSVPMRAVTEGEAATPAKVDIELNALPPPPVEKPAGRLDVLPPDLARGAAHPLPVSAADPSPSAQDAPQLTQVPPRLTTVETPAPLAAPSVGADPCQGAGSRAAHMVCADPDLAAADRELARAYRRALRSGVPPEALRDEQRDWLAIREDAARRSPRAVASIYDQRIEELNRMADDGGDPS